MRRLRSVVELDDGADLEAPRPLTLEELRRLADGGLVEIGAHTVTHPVLSQLPVERQREEVGGSNRTAGFDHACANVPGRIGRGTDPFRLPRVLVRDWRGRELVRLLLEVGP